MFAFGLILLDWIGMHPEPNFSQFNQYPVLNYVFLVIIIVGSAIFELVGHALDPKFHIGRQFNYYKFPSIAGVCTAGIAILLMFLFLGSRAWV